MSDALVSTVVCFNIAIDEFGCRLFDIFVSDFFGPAINFSSQGFESETVSDSEMILLFNCFFHQIVIMRYIKSVHTDTNGDKWLTVGVHSIKTCK